MSRRYFITEVFAEGNYSGNQLATVIDCDGLSGQEMQRIARAFNFAETTFYLGGTEAQGFDVRIFTPDTELPFAGHPTLGTSFLIRNQIENFQTLQLTLNLGVGPIDVRFEADGVIWMRQNKPEFGEQVDREAAALSIGLTVDDLASGFPTQAVSTGLEFLIVPLNGLESLRQARVVPSSSARGVLAFCSEGYRDDDKFASRMFAPGLGVGEDAATGSATGCLAAYLAQYEYLGDSELRATVGQGFEINRPSALQFYARKGLDNETPFIVEVGGKVNLVASGEWHL